MIMQKNFVQKLNDLTLTPTSRYVFSDLFDLGSVPRWGDWTFLTWFCLASAALSVLVLFGKNSNNSTRVH
jgi:hypothetical protein